MKHVLQKHDARLAGSVVAVNKLCKFISLKGATIQSAFSGRREKQGME